MMLCDHDRRPYNTLSLSTAHNDGRRQSTFVLTHVDVGGQGTNVADLLAIWPRSAGKKKAISDSMSYSTRCGRITVIEDWQTATAIETHAAPTSSKECRNSLGPIAGSPLVEHLYKIVE